MAAIDDITDLAQDVYFTINGATNDDEGEDLEIFQNNFIRSFNLWIDEYETEAYWNEVRVDDYTLDTIVNTTDYSFPLPDLYRSPIIDQNKYVKFVNDGIVIAKFQLVNPNQRQVDDSWDRPDRATFVGRNIVLSRAPTEQELNSDIVLDVVEYFPKLTREDSTAIGMVYNKQLAVLGNAKNNALGDLTKVSLSPSFAQKYVNELQKAIRANNATNAVDEMHRDNFGYIGGIY